MDFCEKHASIPSLLKSHKAKPYGRTLYGIFEIFNGKERKSKVNKAIYKT